MKIIINRCHGGFGFSKEAITLYSRYTQITESDFPRFLKSERIDIRTDATMVRVVEELGAAASADYAQLKVVDIPDDVDYTIEDYDGIEWVAEEHRTWS